MSQEIERKIVRKAVRAILSAGYSIKVRDAEMTVSKPSESINEIMNNCFMTCYSVLVVMDAGNVVGSVMIVHGNGVDALSNHSMALDEILKPVCEYVQTLI